MNVVGDVVRRFAGSVVGVVVVVVVVVATVGGCSGRRDDDDAVGPVDCAADALADPGFDDAAAWDVGVATLGDAGGDGVLSFGDAAANCNGDAVADSVIDVPAGCHGATVAVELLAPTYTRGFIVGVGDRTVDVGAGSTVCLGAAMVGAALPFRLRPEPFTSCDEGVRPIVTTVRVEAERRCPAPGTVVPYDSNDGDNFWLVTPGSTSSFDLNAEVLELSTRGCFDQASAQGPARGAVSIADHRGSALVVDVDGVLLPQPSGAVAALRLRLGRVEWALHVGENRLCVPDGLRGTVQPVEITLAHATDAPTCDAPLPEQLARLSPLRLVDDDACADRFVDDLAAFDAVGDVAADDDGARHLRLDTVCDRSGLSGRMTLPRAVVEGPDAAGGPAVFFTYGHTAEDSAVVVTLAPFRSSQRLPPRRTPREEKLCLPPRHDDEAAMITFHVSGPGGFCADALDPPVDVVVSGVRVGLDPDCPR